MKHGKLYWLSVVATMLIAVGCDESSTSTICTDNTRNCDDVEGATNKCANGKCSSTCKEGYGELNGSCLPAMISTWDVTSNNLNLLFSIQGRAGAIVIDWGDGTRSKIDSGDAGYISHAYLNTGIYVITVFGTIEKWSCGNDQNMTLGCENRKACDGLISIRSFGNVTFGICAFAYTPKLESFPAKGTPKFYDNDASYAFYRSSFNNDISGWDTSSITNMSHMFQGASAFNQPIENWDVSNVTNMSYMFAEADGKWELTSADAFPSPSVFNQPLNNWNVSSVTDMSEMFKDARAFNQPLDKWRIGYYTRFVSMSDIFLGSGLNQENYCKTVKGPYSDKWSKADLGLNYVCE